MNYELQSLENVRNLNQNFIHKVMKTEQKLL